jgi:hypothetical protein
VAASMVLRDVGLPSRLSHKHCVYTSHSDELKKICASQAKNDPPLKLEVSGVRFEAGKFWD